MTQFIRLDKFAEVGAGNSAPQNEELFKGGSLPFVRTSDVGAIHIGSIDTSRDLLTLEGAKGLKLHSSGTILFPKSGASTFLNHRVVLGKPAYVSSHLATIKANNDLGLDRYLFYFLQTIDARDLCQDQAYPSLNRDQIAGIEVPLPSLEKQREIVEKLDSAFAEIEMLEEKNLEATSLNGLLLNAKINSEFRAISINESIKTLGEYSKISYGYTAKSSIAHKGPKYLRITDIQNKSVNWQEVPNCEISREEKSKFALEIGDIVFARTGATTGKSFLIEEEVDAVFASYLIRVKPNSDILLPEFLYYFFQSSYYWDEIVGGISGSAQGGFNASKLQAMTVRIPAKKEFQEEIVKRIRDFEVELNIRSSQLLNRTSYISNLRQSLLSSAFTREEEVA